MKKQQRPSPRPRFTANVSQKTYDALVAGNSAVEATLNGIGSGSVSDFVSLIRHAQYESQRK